MDNSAIYKAGLSYEAFTSEERKSFLIGLNLSNKKTIDSELGFVREILTKKYFKIEENEGKVKDAVSNWFVN